MPVYHFEHASENPATVIIHEEEISYSMTEQLIRNEIAQLKENRRAYVNESIYLGSLQMLERALQFLQKKRTA